MAEDPTPTPQPRGRTRALVDLATRSNGRLTASIVLVIGLAIFALLEATPYGDIRQSVFDIYQQLRPRVPDGQYPAIVIDIDEAALQTYGQWPWPRTLTAKLVRLVAALGPAAIAFDIIMPEPDRLSPGEVADLNPLIDEEVKSKLKALPSNDKLLGETLANLPFVVARAGLDVDMQHKLSDLPTLHPVSMDGPDQSARLLSFNELIVNVPDIEAGATGFGLVNTRRDADGVVREVPLLMSVRGQAVPSLALETLRVALGANWITMVSDDDGVRGVMLGDTFIPSDRGGELRLYFSKSMPERRISAAAVLAGNVPDDALNGRIAFIGVSALGLTDVAPTPVDGRMDGVEIHAQVIENIVGATALVRPGEASMMEAAILTVCGIFLILILPRLSPVLGVVTAGVLVTGLCAGAYLIFASAGYLLDPTYPSLVVILITLSILAALLTESIHNRRLLQQALTQERLASARMAGELDAAREIQMGMLPDPQAIAHLPGSVRLHALLEPAREVGGDLYDVFMLNDTELFFLIGDVTGKGVPASLFMAISKVLCKNIVLRPRVSIGPVTVEVNEAISRENPAEMFITLIAGVLDTTSGRGEICVAGHEAPFVVRPGHRTREILTAGGPPLCVIDHFAYQSEPFQLEPGEVMVLATDGVGEAKNKNEELFGRERIRQFLDGLPPSAGPREIVEGLHQDSTRYAEGDENPDDVTIVAIQYVGKASLNER